MTQNTLVTDAKIDWLSKRGLVIRKIDGETVSYYLTDAGKAYLNDKKD